MNPTEKLWQLVAFPVSTLTSRALVRISAASASEHKAGGEKGGWVSGPGAELPANRRRKSRLWGYARWAGNTTDLVLRGDSLPKALAKNYGPEREELTKQHKQGRGAKLPLALPATQAWFHLALPYESFHAGQRFSNSAGQPRLGPTLVCQ